MAGKTCCHVGWSYVAMCHYVKKSIFWRVCNKTLLHTLRVYNDPKHVSVMYLLYRLVIVPFKGGMHI